MSAALWCLQWIHFPWIFVIFIILGKEEKKNAQLVYLAGHDYETKKLFLLIVVIEKKLFLIIFKLHSNIAVFKSYCSESLRCQMHRC